MGKVYAIMLSLVLLIIQKVMSSAIHPAGDDVIALANGIDGCQARKHDKCSIDRLSARSHGIHDDMYAYGDECIQHDGREKTEYGLPYSRQCMSDCIPGLFNVHGLSVCWLAKY